MAGNYRQEVNVNSPLKGQLANSFAQLVRDMSDMKDGGVVTPAHFFKQLQTLAPDLFDYQQQDCQEFLRFVLDGLCEDLCRRKQPVLASNALPALRTRSKVSTILLTAV